MPKPKPHHRESRGRAKIVENTHELRTLGAPDSVISEIAQNLTDQFPEIARELDSREPAIDRASSIVDALGQITSKTLDILRFRLSFVAGEMPSYRLTYLLDEEVFRT